MMLNPGRGDNGRNGADRKLLELIERFSDGADNLKEIMDHQRVDVKNWGNGKLIKFLDLCGLDIDTVALMNVAWCSTAANEYPNQMLRRCFEKHSLLALKSLEPNLVILSGTSVHRFDTDIMRRLPGIRVHKTLHYAHREGHQATDAAAKEIRRLRSSD